MSTSSVVLSMSSSSWGNVLTPLCSISDSMQLGCDEQVVLQRSKWRCLASTYSAEIQDLIQLVKPNHEQQMSRCSNVLAGPLQALQQAVQEGQAIMQAYIPRISEGNHHSWLVDTALKLAMSTDVVDVHLHDFLWASSIVRDQVFRITGHEGQEAHLLEQATKLHKIWLKEDTDADLLTAQSFLIQLKGNHSDNEETCLLVDFILNKLSHIKEAASHNHVTPGSLPPLYMCIHTDQCLQTNMEGIFRSDHTEVREVIWLGGRFVLKSFKHMDKYNHYFEESDEIFREAAIHANIWHPHVVPLVCYTNKPRGLLMELMQEDLADLINRSRENSGNEPPFSLLMAVDLMLQIAKGMKYLHNDTPQHIIHRDLKPANILVSSSNHASTPQVHLKIADFGISKAKLDCSEYTTKDQGTVYWMAPEVYGEVDDSDEPKYSNKADVYSFGIICSEILTGNPPFKGPLRTIRKRVLQGDRPPLPQHCPPALSSFIQMCWHADPTKRPTFIQICRMLRYFKACILLADCDDEARQPLRLLITPNICAPIDDKIDHSLAGRTFHPKALGIPLEMYLYGIHLKNSKTGSSLYGIHLKNSKTGSSISMDSRLLTNNELKTTTDNLDALLDCVTQDVGFSRGRPVAACIIYKSLLQWRSFEAERTNVFDRIIQTIGTAIESKENTHILAYWLTNTSMLLFLLQHTLKAIGGAKTSSDTKASVTSLGRRAAFIPYTGIRSSLDRGGLSSGNGGVIGGLDSLRQVEAKSPALQFKNQLTAFVEKIYKMIRDDLIKEIDPPLGLLIEVPRTSRARLGKAASGSMHVSSTAQQILTCHWHSIIKSLSDLLSRMRANHVSAFFVNKVFTQIFSYINVRLFNSLLLRRESCSFSHGEYLKAFLKDLELWVYEASEKYAGSACDELKHIRQAVAFLVMHQKTRKSLDELTHDLCPVLSMQHIYRISTMYWDDKYGTHSVSPEVIANMRKLMTEESNQINSFLLDVDSSIPFSLDDISKLMTKIDLSLADVDPPPLLQENPDFFFLQPLADSSNEER